MLTSEVRCLASEPSHTAFAAAAYRAAHQVLEQGRIFEDTLAVPILGLDPELFRQNPEAHGPRRGMRFFVVARSHIAEGALKLGVETRGVGQLVVLGAGLDTFAYRNPLGERLESFRGRPSGDSGLEAPAPRRGRHRRSR